MVFFVLERSIAIFFFMHPVASFYCVYLLQSETKPKLTYIGSTPDPYRRLRQHNGEITSGAWKTKRLGFRPWAMRVVVSGFPNKVCALQFEHAFQHAYQTRHIKNRVSTSKNPSLAIRLAYLRCLLTSDYFKRLQLQVNVFDASVLKLWELNKLKAPEYSDVCQWDFEAFVSKTKDFYEIEALYENVKQDLITVADCAGCKGRIDMLDHPELVTAAYCCGKVFHVSCLIKTLLPIYILCPNCNSRLQCFKLALLASKLQKYYNSS